MQDLVFGGTLSDDYVRDCDCSDVAPTWTQPGELRGGRMPNVVVEGDSTDGAPAGAVSAEVGSRGEESERLLREQSPLPFGGRQPEA